MANFSEGITVTVVGVAVVFSVLIIIMAVTSLFKFFAKAGNKVEEKKNAIPQTKNSPEIAQSKIPLEFRPGFDTEDGELVAVIAASISAALGTDSGDIKIRSIRKVN